MGKKLKERWSDLTLLQKWGLAVGTTSAVGFVGSVAFGVAEYLHAEAANDKFYQLTHEAEKMPRPLWLGCPTGLDEAESSAIAPAPTLSLIGKQPTGNCLEAYDYLDALDHFYRAQDELYTKAATHMGDATAYYDATDTALAIGYCQFHGELPGMGHCCYVGTRKLIRRPDPDQTMLSDLLAAFQVFADA